MPGKGGYDADPTGQGLEHRGGLHHARDRDLDLVLLGHGAQFQPDDKALTASIREGQGKIFAEDLRDARAPAEEPAAPTRSAQLLMLNIDAGGVQSRRVLERLIARSERRLAGRARAA